MATQAIAKRSIVKGFLAGAVAGAVGTVVLNTFQSASLKGTEAVENRLPGENTYTGQQGDLLKSYAAAHDHTADAAAKLAGVQLTPAQRRQSEPFIEFAFGTLSGGVYGALAEYLPFITSGFGTSFGAALFAGANEAVLPALGWMSQPAERTPVQHVGGLSGHVVFGAAVEGVRRLVRKAL